MNLPVEKHNLTPYQLTAIEEMAGHGFDFWEIAEVIAADTKEICDIVNALNHKRSEAYRAYRKGYLKSQLELRQRIFIDAKHGSSPAQALAKKILDDAEYKFNNL